MISPARFSKSTVSTEIETKIVLKSESDKLRIENKILSLGGFFLWEGRITGQYYVKGEEKIRVRHEKDGCVICKKTTIEDDKKIITRREEQTTIYDTEEIDYVRNLMRNGYSLGKSINKMRKSFILGSNNIEIDTMNDGVIILEIEGDSKKSVSDCVKILGYSLVNIKSKLR